MRKIAVLLVLAILGLAPAAHAATINYLAPGGTNYTTAAVTGYQTSGNDMSGMLVTVEVAYWGGTYTMQRTWGDLGGGTWGVDFGGYWDDFNLTLGATEDTFNGTWNFQTDGWWGGTYIVNSITFDGTAGKTLFDRTFGGATGTAGSELGRDFSEFNAWGGTVNAYYFNPVGLGAAAPLGDIYAGFTATFLGGLAPGYYSFMMDTDNATTAIVPQVPEPASLLLLGSGLIGLAGAARRRLRR